MPIGWYKDLPYLKPFRQYIGDSPYSLDKGYTLGHVLSDPNSGSHSGGLYIGFEAVSYTHLQIGSSAGIVETSYLNELNA